MPADGVHEFLDVVVAFNGKDALLSVILAAQMHQEDEFFFFNPWKLEGFLVQNHHHSAQNLFILIKKSTSSGVNLNQAASGLAFCFCRIILMKGTKSCFAIAVGNVALGTDFAAYTIKHGSFAFSPEQGDNADWR